MALAKQGNLPGADQIVLHQKDQFFAFGALQGVLWTRKLMETLKQIPAQPGQKSPILVYFGTLLGKGKLNGIESVELAQLVLAQNKDLLAN